MLWDLILSLPPAQNSCEIFVKAFTHKLYKCVLTFKESFFETVGSYLQSAEPWTEIESNGTLAFLFVKVQL